MYALRFLGSVTIEDADGNPVDSLSQPRALGVLAVISAAGRDGCTRDKLVAALWPELDSTRARHALSVLLHQIRRTLGRDAVLTSGEFLRINPDRVAVDATAFGDAVRDGHLARAADLYRGPFFDGVHLSNAPEFERWADDERQRLAVEVLRVLETLAADAERQGQALAAASWWHRATQHDPYNSRVALFYARALASVGDRGNGVQFLEDHVRRLRTELEIEPDETILEAIRTGDFGVVPDYSNGHAPPASGDGSDHLPENAERAGGSEAPLTASTTVPRGRVSRWRRWSSVVVVLLAVSLAGALALPGRHANGGTLRTIAILPTNVVGLEESIGGLIASHLYAGLAEWRAFTAVGSDAAGAGLVLRSRTAPVPQGVELQVALVRPTDDVTIATAHTAGATDSLRPMAERVLLPLIARAEGLEEHEIAVVSGHDLYAARLFVTSRRAGPDERRRLLREALDRDSTFALAAMVLLDDVVLMQGAMREDPWRSVAHAAWKHRDRLSVGDRAYVEALVGWQFIPEYSAAQLMSDWARAVEIAPDRPRNLRGFAVACYRWCSQLGANWKARILETHDRLLDLGEVDPFLLERGMEVAFLAGDTARMQRYAELMPEDLQYGQWLAAAAFGNLPDTAKFARMVREEGFLGMRVGNLATLTGDGLEYGMAAAGVERASGRVHQLIGQVSARTRGRHAEYRSLRDKMLQLEHTMAAAEVFLYNLIVWEWAYFQEPESDSVLDQIDRGFQSLIERQPVLAPDTLATVHCARAQLRLGRGDTTGVGDGLAYLRSDPQARGLAVSRLCAPFLELLVVRHNSGDPDAVSRVTRRLGDVLRVRPLDEGAGDGMYNVQVMLATAANLVLARSLFELGYPESAYSRIIRRPYAPGTWDIFGFHIDFLREEARFRAAAGATEEALVLYDRYFRLRPEPPDLAAWRTEWETARVEYEALKADAGA